MLAEIVLGLAEALKDNRLAVLCGAGISREASLPTVRDALPEILSHLLVLDKRTEESIGPGSSEQARELEVERRARLLLDSRLPFEYWIELLDESEDLELLRALFHGGTPGRYHRFLARLLQLGYVNTLCTTNFDCLLETALSGLGWHAGEDYELLFTAEQLQSADYTRPCPRLVKLHGSLSEPSSIVATLKAVSRRAGVHYLTGIVEYLFASGPHSHLLTLGYSFSDHFDINQILGQAGSSAKVLVQVEHRPGMMVCKELRMAGEGPLAGFSKGMCIYCSTEWLVGELAKETVPSLEPWACPDQQSEWTTEVGSWARRYASRYGEDWQKSKIGLLFFHSGHVELAARYFQEVSESTRPSVLTQRFLSDVGVCYLRLGKLVEAQDALVRAYEESVARDDGFNVILSLVNLGLARARLGSAEDGVELHLLAVEIARSNGDNWSLALALCNLASAHLERGNLDEAWQHAELALPIAVRIGHKYVEGRLWDAMGSVSFRRRQHEEALAHYRNALEIARRIGDKEGEGNALGNIGNVHGRMGHLAQSITMNEQALEIARSIGDRLGEAIRLYNLGTSHLHAADFIEAESAFAHALDKSKTFLGHDHPLVRSIEAALLASELARLL